MRKQYIFRVEASKFMIGTCLLEDNFIDNNTYYPTVA